MKALFISGAIALLSLAAATEAKTIAGNCNPVAIKTCGLPFPSDLFMDAATQRLKFDDTLIDNTIDGPIRQQQPMLAQMDPAFTPAKIFDGASGFSAAGPILFELTAAAATVLPKDGGEFVKLFDLDSGQATDIVARFSKAAKHPQDPARASDVIEIWPRSRFEFGHRYVAVLTSALRMKTASGGADFTRSNGMDIALGLRPASTQNEIALVDAYREAVAVLQNNAITPQQILSATFFTVRQEQEVTAPLLKMADIIAERDLRITALQAGKPLDTSPYALATLYGRIDLVNFRGADGGVHAPYEPIAFPAQENVEILATVPKVDPASDIPIALWGHGVGNRKEVTTLGFVRNDALGIATVAIDHPNHGSRINNLDPLQRDYLNLGTPKQIMKQLGAQVQASIDQIAVMAAVRNSIGTAFDEARSTVPALAHGDGSRIAYHARSYGSMIGVSAVAASHDVIGAHYLSGCGGLTNITASSLFWSSSKNNFPHAASGAEVTFQLAMMQQYLDIADGINFAHYYRNPPAGREPKKVAMQYALGDGSTLNEVCEAQAIVMQLPLLRQVLKPVPLLPHGEEGIDGFEDGYGIYQLPYIIPNAEQQLQRAAQFDQQLAQSAQNQGKPPPTFSLVATLMPLLYNDYNGFRTHWNVVTRDSTDKSIDWNCEVLRIPQELCERARLAPLAKQ